MVKTIVAFVLASLSGLLTGHHTAAEAPGLLAPAPLLVGVVMPDGGEPKAILEDPTTHEQAIYPLGAQIGNGHLTKILRDRVVLTTDGGQVEVRLAGSPPPPPGTARRSGPLPRPGRRSLGAQSGTGR